jgi:repressor LexA
MTTTGLSSRQQEILEFIDAQTRERGYPPSVREIGSAVGLTSPSTVHSHLATLQDRGYLRRDPSKPRALEVCLDPVSGAAVDRGTARHIPLVGEVAAGTDVLAHENIMESVPMPVEFTGEGDLFMLRVRGESMIGAGIPGDEGTVKYFERDGETVVLVPANPAFQELRYPSDEVTIFGLVVTVLRRI